MKQNKAIRFGARDFLNNALWTNVTYDNSYALSIIRDIFKIETEEYIENIREGKINPDTLSLINDAEVLLHYVLNSTLEEIEQAEYVLFERVNFLGLPYA